MMIHTRAAGVLIAALCLFGCATTNNAPANGSAKVPCAENTGSRLPAGNCSSAGSYTHADSNQIGR